MARVAPSCEAGKGVPRAELFTRSRSVLLAWLAVHAGAAYAADLQQAPRTPASLARMSIEELGEIEVSAVSRRSERLADAAAAIYVITRDDIRRAGVSTLAEALRLAPNLQVARVNASSYAISARGFNSESANKLLVMIDGRSVYTPLHSGVFWDVQDVMLADIDRIEVVSGPGGTLWGANAVNGVINILTRSAHDSKGTLVGASAGNDDRGAALRHGFDFGDDGAARFYGRTYRVDATVHADGSSAGDAWNRRQLGFRADWGPEASNWTAQGDVYDGEAQVPGSPNRTVSGANLLARYRRQLGPQSSWQAQLYVDSTRRDQPGFFTENLDTIDLDLQQRISLASGHDLVWGGGYRAQRDRTGGGALFAFVPADSRLRLANLFAQDTVQLDKQLSLTLGIKLEHNNYTGLESQPSARLAWKFGEHGLLWSAVSRAVRIPSRLDRDFNVFVDLPPPYSGHLLGGPGFQSERVTAYEVGYRAQPTATWSYSVSTFYNDYDRLRSIEPDGSGNFVLGNGVKGRTYGLEAWGSYQVSDNWRLDAGLSLLRQSFAFAPGSADPGSANTTGNDPPSQFQLRSTWTLPRDVNVDLRLRRIGALPQPAVSAYTALDARLGWRIVRGVELSLIGLNLLDAHHPEFGTAPTGSESPRSVALRLTWAH